MHELHTSACLAFASLRCCWHSAFCNAAFSFACFVRACILHHKTSVLLPTIAALSQLTNKCNHLFVYIYGTVWKFLVPNCWVKHPIIHSLIHTWRSLTTFNWSTSAAMLSPIIFSRAERSSRSRECANAAAATSAALFSSATAAANAV